MLCWLVVDDSDLIRRVAGKILEDMNHMVIEAETGAAAIAQCQKAMPDLILLDWLLQDMSGHDVLSAIKSIKADRRPVIVYCTTQNDPVDIAKAFAGGAEAYMMKPFNREILQRKVNEVMALAA